MSNTVGVVIGRFQVENLHEGHRYLINEAFRNHKRVIILVGCSPIQGTKHDPLDYHTRERMLRAAYPDAIISHIHDMLDDHQWSQQVDNEIQRIIPNLTGARIYGGRDSFKSHYHGKYEALALEGGIQYQSGTAQREDIGKVTRGTADFRAGIIYSTQNSWPYVKMCVDVACVRQEKKWIDIQDPQNPENKGTIDVCETQILLGRKSSENKWRLPGGMMDKGETLESGAARELEEETGIKAGKLTYIGSSPVADWRMKHAGEIGLLTALFFTRYNGVDAIKADDDLAEVKWVPLSEAEDLVIKGHKQLIVLLKNYLKI